MNVTELASCWKKKKITTAHKSTFKSVQFHFNFDSEPEMMKLQNQNQSDMLWERC